MHAPQTTPASHAPAPRAGAALSHWGLVALLCGLGGVATAYGSAFAPWPWSERGVVLMAVSQPLVLVGAMALATSARLAADRCWRWALLLTWLLATVGLVGPLLMAAEPVNPTLWFGLPRRAALLFGLVGAAPMVVLPLVYAVTFSPLPAGTPESSDAGASS